MGINMDDSIDWGNIPPQASVIPVAKKGDFEKLELGEQYCIPTRCQMCKEEVWMPFDVVPIYAMLGPLAAIRVCFDCVGEFTVELEKRRGPSETSMVDLSGGSGVPAEHVQKQIEKATRKAKKKNEQN